jgi:hypothetical protein
MLTEERIDMAELTNTILKLLIDNTPKINSTHAHANSVVSRVRQHDMVQDKHP